MVSEAAAVFLSEYNQRSRLRKLGYGADFGSISCVKAEAFALISCEIDAIQEEEAKKRAKRRG